MSNTSITNVEITDTFQTWISKTNELIDLANENVMLAGPSGFTIDGNSTLTGTFTANTLNANTATIDSLSIINLSRSVDSDNQIVSLSPIQITSSVENIFTLQSSVGNRPILRMINGGNSRWSIAHETASSSSGLSIKTEGATTPQATLSQSGRLTAIELAGDGSNITNLSVSAIPDLDASKVTTGEFDTDRIPNLNADKITAGTIANAILPASATRGEISVSNLTSTSSSEQGFISGRRFRSALTWDNVDNKPNVVETSRRLIGGTGILVSGNGDLSSDRTISIDTNAVARLGTTSGFVRTNSENDSRFASISHNHSANQITTDTLNIQRIPVLTRVNETFAQQSNTSDLSASLTLTMEQSGTVVVWYVGRAFGSFSSNSRIERGIFLNGALISDGFSLTGANLPGETATLTVALDRFAGSTFTIEGRNTRLRSVQGSEGRLIVMRIYR